jgi:hypothetical protein
MNYFKIICRIFAENKNLSLRGKVYITKDYLQNIRFMKKNADNIYNFHRYKYKIESNKKEREPTPKSDFANMKLELSEIRSRIRNKKINNVKNKLLSFLKFLNLRYLLELKNTQNNIQLFFEFLSRQIGNYKRAIQELVEGQREVTQNQDFKFEDGETVKDKMDRFDAKVKELFHINKKN